LSSSQKDNTEEEKSKMHFLSIILVINNTSKTLETYKIEVDIKDTKKSSLSNYKKTHFEDPSVPFTRDRLEEHRAQTQPCHRAFCRA
jgi:hypothetical protein